MGQAEHSSGVVKPLSDAGYWKPSSKKKFVVAIKYRDVFVVICPNV